MSLTRPSDCWCLGKTQASQLDPQTPSPRDAREPPCCAEPTQGEYSKGKGCSNSSPNPTTRLGQLVNCSTAQLFSKGKGCSTAHTATTHTSYILFSMSGHCSSVLCKCKRKSAALYRANANNMLLLLLLLLLLLILLVLLLLLLLLLTCCCRGTQSRPCAVALREIDSASQPPPPNLKNYTDNKKQCRSTLRKSCVQICCRTRHKSTLTKPTSSTLNPFSVDPTDLFYIKPI